MEYYYSFLILLSECSMLIQKIVTFPIVLNIIWLCFSLLTSIKAKRSMKSYCFESQKNKLTEWNGVEVQKKKIILAGAKRVVFSAHAENGLFYQSRCRQAATASAWDFCSAMYWTFFPWQTRHSRVACAVVPQQEFVCAIMRFVLRWKFYVGHHVKSGSVKSFEKKFSWDHQNKNRAFCCFLPWKIFIIWGNNTSRKSLEKFLQELKLFIVISTF